MNKLSVRLAAVAFAVALSGCAALDEPARKATRVEERAVIARDSAVAAAASAAVQRTKRPRISGDEVVLRAGAALPAKFSTPVSYATHGFMGFNEALEQVSSIAGISIRGVETLQTSGGNAGASATVGLGGEPTTKLGGAVEIEYSGTLRGLLDEMAARKDASWRYSARTNTVTFFRYETRVLNLHLPAGAKSVAATISLTGSSGGSSSSGGGSSGGGSASGGDSGSSSGAGNVTVSQNKTIDPWRSVMNTVQSILAANGPARSGAAQSNGQSQGGAGMGMGMSQGQGATGSLTASGADGTASAAPELGMLTITARPQAVERIVSFVNSINSRFAQNVLIDVKVLSVSLDDNAQAGISMDLLYKALNQNGVSVAGAAPLQPANGTPGSLTFSIANPNSRYNGSSLVAEALSQFGRVASEDGTQIMAINGQPAPFQIGSEVGYLASSTVSQAASVGTQTALQPGSKVVGLTGNFTPTVTGDNRILLEYQMEMSSLVLRQVNSGNSMIQTPTVSRQSLQNQTYVRDGEVIMLFANDNVRNSADSSFGLGGASRVGRGERKMIVIVLQVSGGRRYV